MRPSFTRSAPQRISSIGDLLSNPLLVMSAPKERWRAGPAPALLLPALKVKTGADAGGVGCAGGCAALAQNSAGERCGGAAASGTALGLLA